jgi:hypothetical protein
MSSSVKRAKIVSETIAQASQFQNKDGSVKMQDIARVQFEGLKDVLNVGLNKATINGLIDAFGDDSVAWQNKVLAVETEKVRVGGVARVAIYLIPSGFEKVDDENGYAVIQRKGTARVAVAEPPMEEGIPQADEEDEVNPAEIPF